MRKSSWIILVVLVVILGAPSAHADSYTADFTCSLTCMFTPVADNPVVFSVPTHFTFTIDDGDPSTSFTVTLPPAVLPTDVIQWGDSYYATDFDGEYMGLDYDLGYLANGELRIQDVTNSEELANIVWHGEVPSMEFFGNGLDTGLITFTPVETTLAPEPDSASLMLLGIGLVFVAWKQRVAIVTHGAFSIFRSFSA